MPNPKLQPSLFDHGIVTQLAEAPEVASLRETSKALRAIELISAVTGLSTEHAEEVLKKAGSAHHLARLTEHALKLYP
jgi:hypothetical protein